LSAQRFNFVAGGRQGVLAIDGLGLGRLLRPLGSFSASIGRVQLLDCHVGDTASARHRFSCLCSSSLIAVAASEIICNADSVKSSSDGNWPNGGATDLTSEPAPSLGRFRASSSNL
jgi:hypothetical protein